MAAKDFAGREKELEMLSNYMDDANAGRATYVFISGESGMGKSRLADEFTSRLRSSAHVLRHRNTPGERSVPFAGLRELLTQCKREKVGGPGELVKLRDILDAKSKGKGDLKKERDVLQSGVLAFFAEASKLKPIVISLGEVQWLDESSVAMLQRMVHDLRKSRVLLIGTYCPDELEDSAGNALPFTEALASMLVEGLVAMMPLDRLSEERTGELVAQRAGLKRPDPNLTRLIFAESEGLPLFTIEIVDSLLESGILDPEKKGMAKGFDASKFKMPKGVKEAIGERLDALHADVREVLSSASVLGNEFHAKVLTKILSAPKIVIGSALAELVSRKLIIEVTGAEEETYRFAHSKVQQVAYARLGKSVAAAIHAKAAKALLSIHPEVPEWVAYELVPHLSAAGEHEQAAKYCRKAAAFATNSHAIEEALRYYKMALDSLTKVQPSRGRDLAEADTLVELAGVQYSGGEWDAALASYRKAFAIGEKTVEAAAMSKASAGLGEVLRFRGDYSEAKINFRRVLDLAIGSEDDLALAVALKGLGYIEWRLGKFDEAESHYTKAYEIAKRLNDSVLLGIVTLERGNVCTARGDLAGAERGYRESIAFTQSGEDAFTLARAYNNLGDISLQRRDWTSAISNFEMCSGIARSICNHDLLGWSLFNLGEALAKKGELDKAEAACVEALAILSKLNDRTGIAGIHKNLGVVHSLRGDWKKAEKSFSESARMEEEMNTPHALAETYIEWGEALARKKDMTGAREKLTHAIELADKIDAKEFARRAREALESLK
ncbi:MAG: tetratricopeptide repeat protein [Methanobacteriota archaeon]